MDLIVQLALAMGAYVILGIFWVITGLVLAVRWVRGARRRNGATRRAGGDLTP